MDIAIAIASIAALAVLLIVIGLGWEFDDGRMTDAEVAERLRHTFAGV